jgi:hypothetical protein
MATMTGGDLRAHIGERGLMMISGCIREFGRNGGTSIILPMRVSAEMGHLNAIMMQAGTHDAIDNIATTTADAGPSLEVRVPLLIATAILTMRTIIPIIAER